MVEAAVAIPFFIIIFASLLYAAALYGEKQHTLGEARQKAWTYALANCSGSGATRADESDPMQDLGNQGAGSPSQVGQYSGQANGADLMRSWGTATATAKGTVVASGLIGGMTNKLSTTTRMQCNEKPEDGSVRGVLHLAWGLFKFW